MQSVKLVEAQFENGVFRPDEHMHLRSGERVHLIVLPHADPSRWDLARLTESANAEDLPLAEQGLAEWADALDAKDRS